MSERAGDCKRRGRLGRLSDEGAALVKLTADRIQISEKVYFDTGPT